MIGIGKAFGFSVPPRVDLNLSARGDKSSSRQKKRPRAQEDADNGSSGDHLFHSQLEKIILLYTDIINNFTNVTQVGQRRMSTCPRDTPSVPTIPTAKEQLGTKDSSCDNLT